MRTRSVRGTTVQQPALRRQRADEIRPRTGASARGESAADLGPGDCLDGPAIELRDAPVHLSCPSGLGVLVDVGIEAIEQGAGKCRAGLGRERQGLLQDLRCVTLHAFILAGHRSSAYCARLPGAALMPT